MKNNRFIYVKINEDYHHVVKKLLRLGIQVFDVKEDGESYSYKILENDFDNLPFENIENIKHFGIKWFILKLRLNCHFIFSVFSTILVIYFFSNMIFKVEVIHNNLEIRNLIYDELKSSGIHPFIFKKDFQELKKIKDAIKSNLKDKVEWIEIEENGMKYSIKVEERIKNNPTKNAKYCNIVSTKNAIISKIYLKKGQIVKDINEYVKDGDTIISGTINYNDEIKNVTCADAKVYGITWYKVNISIPLAYTHKKFTGKNKNNMSFFWKDKNYEIFKVHYTNYETKRKKILAIGNFILYLDINSEYIPKKMQYNNNEAENEALRLAREKLKLSLGKDVNIKKEKILQTTSYNSIIDIEIFFSVEDIISKIQSDIILSDRKEGFDVKTSE